MRSADIVQDVPNRRTLAPSRGRALGALIAVSAAFWGVVAAGTELLG